MIEDVIETYKRNCTIYGQFDILYNNCKRKMKKPYYQSTTLIIIRAVIN